jgi:hypothetical protein
VKFFRSDSVSRSAVLDRVLLERDAVLFERLGLAPDGRLDGADRLAGVAERGAEVERDLGQLLDLVRS